MDDSVDVTLPHGRWVDGVRRADARLRPLTGEDEALIAERPELTGAARTTALLVRCVAELGGGGPSADDIRGLTVGDREALLLHLRRLTFGDKLDCVVTCPEPECEERMDVELTVEELLVAPYDNVADTHDLDLGDEGARRSLRFRLPTGADQEAVAAVAALDIEAAVELVVRRCVAELERHGHALPPEATSALSAAMADLDPQAEVRLMLSCVGCGEEFSVLLDAGDFLFREIAPRSDDLSHDVHRLAFHYHWSERDILTLAPARRRRYLDLVAEELSRGRER